MKIVFTLLAVVALMAPGCKKDKKEKAGDTTATKPADTKPADTEPDDTKPTEVKPAAPAIPEVAMTGTPAENLTAVMAASATAIKTASPGDAAMILTGILAKYNVADMREKAKAAKGTDKAATEDQKKAYLAAEAAYKARAEELKKDKDAAAFGAAAQAWAAAWGIK